MVMYFLDIDPYSIQKSDLNESDVIFFFDPDSSMEIYSTGSSVHLPIDLPTSYPRHKL